MSRPIRSSSTPTGAGMWAAARDPGKIPGGLTKTVSATTLASDLDAARQERTAAAVPTCVPRTTRKEARDQRNDLLPSPSAAGHRRLPADDRPSVRRTREVRPGAGGRDEGRSANPAGRTEERGAGRPRAGGHLFRRHDLDCAAVAEAAGRNGEGAGRGRTTGADRKVHRAPGVFRGGRGRRPGPR